jgi:hypothetical protein
MYRIFVSLCLFLLNEFGSTRDCEKRLCSDVLSRREQTHHGQKKGVKNKAKKSDPLFQGKPGHQSKIKRPFVSPASLLMMQA